MMAGLCLALMLVLSPMAVLGQTPYMVKDINTTQDVGSSNPTLFTQVGSKTFFVAYVPGEGYQLWKTDGTASGTALVTNQYYGYVSSMTNSNGKLFFLVSSSSGGYSSNGGVITGGSIADLWISDGTADGTKMLRYATMVGTTSGAAQGTLTDVNGTLFFVSDDGALGNALWKTDGTPEGTVMVKAMPFTCPPGAIACGPTYGNSVLPLSLTAVNGTLFFITGTLYSGTAPTASTIATLWKSDGTEAGTTVVKPTVNLVPANLTNVNGLLLFTGLDLNAGSGNALWQSDGTAYRFVEDRRHGQRDRAGKRPQPEPFDPIWDTDDFIQ